MQLGTRNWRRGARLAAAAIVAAGASVPASAQRPCIAVADSARVVPWTPPLDARVTLHARDVTLRDALERVSSLSGVQLAYASDLLPLDRSVCVDATSASVGSVLTVLLEGAGAEPTVIAGRVVLAPTAGLAAPGMARGVGTLERVIVTGSAVAAARRPLSIGVEVVDGEQLRRESRATLPEILNAAAPGIWLWQQPSSSLVAQYAGIRGTSSFSSSYPKIYIDGIEVANPLLVTQFDPEIIDRVEVIRGPQGSALYGSDAISGVINVVTRHDGGDPRNLGVHVSSSAGAGASYRAGPVPTHEQQIGMRGGSNLRSAGASLEFGQMGAVIPGSDSRHFLASADARAVGPMATLAATARYADKRAGAGNNPLLTFTPASTPTPIPAAADSNGDQMVRQYTVGTSATLAPGGRWTHSALVGLDGYHLDNVAESMGPFVIGIDSALRAAEGSGNRATMRATTVGEIGGDDGSAPLRLTFGVEHAVLRQVQRASATTTGTSTTTPPALPDVVTWNHNTGVFAQVGAEWNNTFYLTGGLRVEHNDAFTGSDRLPVLPLVGVAVVRDVSGMQIKLRSAYGKGIRPPQTPARAMAERQRSLLSPALDPESQSGIETGLEIYSGRTFSLQVTRFDQLASGLVQNVFVGVDSVMMNGRLYTRVRYQLQNVGEIGNHGWEMQATAHVGDVALTSTFTTVDSRVQRVGARYNGDLRVGDRLLSLPARTGSLSASWTGERWFASLVATRAWDWMDYDRYKLAQALATGGATVAKNLVGEKLRSFWMHYSGDTHLRLTTSFRVHRTLELMLIGDNLLGGQLGEPDNVTIRAGRTITGGFRADF